MNLIEESIKYLINESDGKKITFKSDHPWRSDGLHIVQHALRVKAYVEEIIKKEKIILNDIDKIALPLSAILHDIGSLHGKEGHGEKSVEMIQPFLNKVNIKSEVIKRINELIATHSFKKMRNDDLIMNVLKDADALDEIGMQSILMSANWINRESAFFFVDLEDRLEHKELEFIDKVIKILYFDASKKIVEKRMEFIKLATQQLHIENSGSLSREEYETIKLQNSILV